MTGAASRSNICDDDVDALGLEIGFLRRTGDVDLDHHRDLRVERDLDVVHAERLDRAIEHDLALGYLRANAFQRFRDVAGTDRAVEMADV